MAGVSEGTVDRVIHNRGNVSVDTEKKIQGILEKTGYTSNPIARSLGSRKDYQIEVMIPNPKQDEYWQLSETGIDKALVEWEPYSIAINLKTFDLEDPNSFVQTCDTVLQSEPDAILTASVFYEETLAFSEKLQEVEIPYIVFNTQIDENIKKFDPLCFVGQNMYQSGMVAAEMMHIAMREPREIAVFHIHENVKSSIHLKEKEQGFRDYFTDFIQSDIKIHTFTFLDRKDSFEAQIEECIQQNDLQGIFVPTSSGAYLTSQALENQSKKDTILIGYDLLGKNIHYLNRGTINFLINQNPQLQAYQGVRHLVNHLLLNLEIPPAYLLPLEIITRQNYSSFMNNNY